mmetsp:Transcript_16012/g.54380  ORF Transcript_16012/g.54380 Transcript_16012/m.54380 type:complete len:203 (-) Transcript_16012:62-670(-)
MSATASPLLVRRRSTCTVLVRGRTCSPPLCSRTTLPMASRALATRFSSAKVKVVTFSSAMATRRSPRRRLPAAPPTEWRALSLRVASLPFASSTTGDRGWLRSCATHSCTRAFPRRTRCLAVRMSARRSLRRSSHSSPALRGVPPRKRGRRRRMARWDGCACCAACVGDGGGGSTRGRCCAAGISTWAGRWIPGRSSMSSVA